ncbi:methyl-accepting chemotaxis protein [Piscinibacter gummiphilus]|uniref:Methyl-accepting chemotaxis protein n=1 Tax=Piscinibacter gummiphilus TaxID=946333 RepID=A0ABZ0D0U4_9BURK|nr:methyl-accepting chemotaxis protein [Piscinibacter gummiphilus]WOB10833.1 methyl-accepting chemotaxis protein [Piscinibacter gummiphilus]
MTHTAPAQEQSIAPGFFKFHGPWAPGVRLFRRLSFQAKAALVSIGFLLPLLMLLGAYLKNVQDSIDFTTRERAGLTLLAKIEPWLIEVQKQRRLVLSGMSPKVDVAAIDATLRSVQVAIAGRPEGVDVTGALADVLKVHASVADAVAAGADARRGGVPIQAYVDAVRAMRQTVLDRSGLALDPEQATYYLMLVSTTVVSDVIESVSRSRGLAGAAEPDGSNAQQLRELYGVWHSGEQQLHSTRDALDRAQQAEASLASRVPHTQALGAARTFFDQSRAAWFGPGFRPDVQALNGPGQVAVDELRALSAKGLAVLDDLLDHRIAEAQRLRNLTLMGTFVSLAAVGYLFYCFYLVMNGGLREVERHLLAMTQGDLTTTPQPWGRDEAAALMLTLSDMQTALRAIVSEVRTTANGLVFASNEISSASMDLSHRSEQAAANLEESASAMEQISVTVSNTAQSTESASQLAADNAKVASVGGQTISEVIDTMSGVQAASGRIADIIGVIDGIAFQTNILALNAAVEAARAGEQGRGFAVVASEVRALAQRSANAAKEIKTLITESVERVDSGSRIVAQAGQQMGQLVATADRMKSLMVDVLSGTTEQSSGVRLVSDALQTLDQQTQQNAALVEQTASAASSLHSQANALATSVARFRL